MIPTPSPTMSEDKSKKAEGIILTTDARMCYNYISNKGNQIPSPSPSPGLLILKHVEVTVVKSKNYEEFVEKFKPKKNKNA